MGLIDWLLRIFWPSWQRSFIGKFVYFQETGEKIGIVNNEIKDANKKVIGYEILDKDTGSVLYFPAEQFEKLSRGLILQPLWYSESKKLIRQLELYETVVPEISSMVFSKELPKEELYNILSKKDPKLKALVDRGLKLRDALEKRYEIMNNEADKLRENTVMIIGDKMLGIDKTDFAKSLVEYRRKISILDANIKRSQELISRLNALAFIPPTVTIPIEKELMEGIKEIKLPFDASQVPCETYKHGKCPLASMLQMLPQMPTATGVQAQPPRKPMEAKPLRVIKMEETVRNIEDRVREKILAELRAQNINLPVSPPVVSVNKVCITCGATFDSTLTKCPACGMEESGAPKELPTERKSLREIFAKKK